VTRKSIPAVFARGGTSKGLIFLESDLPSSRDKWAPLFLTAMGSPDPSGRQLNGMGGGVSSLSKICVVGPSRREDADVDYTFVQVQIRTADLDFSGNCGNMASAIGPFAVEQGLVDAADGEVTVRIHNTNTAKIIHSTFHVESGEAIEEGDLSIPGVAGSSAPVRLDFVSPGGATTGQLLPTGRVSDVLQTSHGEVFVSLVDAGNACVFVPAEAVGARGDEKPEQLEALPEVLAFLAELRELGSIRMGIATDREEARVRMLVPLIAMVSPPQTFAALSGATVCEDEIDITVRMISNGQPHRAIPMTGAICVAAAVRIPETVVSNTARAGGGPLRIGMPSGILTVDADVDSVDGDPVIHSGAIFRTTRRLFRGDVTVS